MTNAELIATIRGLIREVSDDTAFTDQYLYRIASSARNLLFIRKLNKFKHTSEWEWRYFCVPLEKAMSHDCDCIKVGCTVLKTKYTIPRALNSRNKDMIKIRTLGNIEIPIVPDRSIETFMLDPIMSKNPMASIVNRRIIVWNNLKFKAINVGAIWEDISQWDGKDLCDSEGEITDCFDFYNEEFVLDPEFEYDVYRMVANVLNLPLQLVEDNTNDASNVIKQ